MRQPSRSLSQIDDGRAVGAPQKFDHQRQFAAVSRGHPAWVVAFVRTGAIFRLRLRRLDELDRVLRSLVDGDGFQTGHRQFERVTLDGRLLVTWLCLIVVVAQRQDMPTVLWRSFKRVAVTKFRQPTPVKNIVIIDVPVKISLIGVAFHFGENFVMIEGDREWKFLASAPAAQNCHAAVRQIAVPFVRVTESGREFLANWHGLPTQVNVNVISGRLSAILDKNVDAFWGSLQLGQDRIYADIGTQTSLFRVTSYPILPSSGKEDQNRDS